MKATEKFLEMYKLMPKEYIKYTTFKGYKLSYIRNLIHIKNWRRYNSFMKDMGFENDPCECCGKKNCKLVRCHCISQFKKVKKK